MSQSPSVREAPTGPKLNESARRSASIDAQSRSAASPAELNRRYFLVGGGLTVVIGLALNPGLVRDVRDQFLPKRWGVVEPGKIYRSGQISAKLVKRMLEEHHIARVVDLTLDNPTDSYHEAELSAIAELGIERQLFPLRADGTGDVNTYAAAVAAVAEAERAGRPVLVHCVAGTQRTGGVIAAYRLLVQRKDPRDVFVDLCQYKYNPRHSPKLLAYLNEHMQELAEELVRLGAIEQVPDPLPVLVAE